jgi:hypothetical protein
MKIGMALGVALVGIVGALFFRREPEVKQTDVPPPLQKAEELDREIAEKAKSPYIKGLEEFDNPAPPVPAPQSAGAKGPNGSAAAGAPSFLTKDEEARQRNGLSRKPGAAPDPISGAKKDEAIANDTSPAHNRDWEPTGPAGAPAKKAGDSPRPNSTATGPGRTHVIQPGDTLSGLASRYLGSSARYREIYEANRNVLKSPDDVRDGMTLVIPDGGKVPGSPSAADKPAADVSVARQTGTKVRSASVVKPGSDAEVPATVREPSADAPREKLRFVPVPRGPFSAGRIIPPMGAGRSDSGSPRTGAARSDSLDDDQ